MTLIVVVAVLALAAWIYLLLFRGGFWLARQRDDADPPEAPRSWPSVTAIIPARNESEMLPASLGSLSAQRYPGGFSIVLVDDQSSDGTLDVARKVAKGAARDVAVIEGRPPPGGWTGKVWAMHQGFRYVGTSKKTPDYLLFTDADIVYAPTALRDLVARAKAHELVLTSVMAKLNCESLAERALIPAFVFFFQMLYPFAWVNRSSANTAAAAGGCMLVETAALKRAGGLAPIRAALIDDCALAALLKKEGPIWLGLSESVRSARPYPALSDIRRMVARSAYAQLDYSPFMLAVTIACMALAFLTPPLLALGAAYPANLVGAAAWALMAVAYLPILRLYRVSPLWALALPSIAAAYVAFTLDSAYQHWRGRGGLWKGRSQALAAKR